MKDALDALWIAYDDADDGSVGAGFDARGKHGNVVRTEDAHHVQQGPDFIAKENAELHDRLTSRFFSCLAAFGGRFFCGHLFVGIDEGESRGLAFKLFDFYDVRTADQGREAGSGTRAILMQLKNDGLSVFIKNTHGDFFAFSVVPRVNHYWLPA